MSEGLGISFMEPTPPLAELRLSHPSVPQLSAALMFDAVHVWWWRRPGAEPQPGDRTWLTAPACSRAANIWPHGTSLMNYLAWGPGGGGPAGAAACTGTGALCVPPSPRTPLPCASTRSRLLAPSGPAFLRLCCSPPGSRPLSLSRLLSVHLWSFLVPLPLSLSSPSPLGPCHPSLCPPPRPAR